MITITEEDVLALKEHGAVAVPALFEPTVDRLYKEAAQLTFKERERRTATQVLQNVSAVDEFAGDSYFRSFAKEANDSIAFAFRKWNVFGVPLALNDLALQRYPVREPGDAFAISPHVDYRQCVNLVAVYLLAGESAFYVCDDREGRNARLIEAEPGDLILMRGVGFAGIEERPFHYVGSVNQERLTFALRQM